MNAPSTRPRLFIGSSVESLHIAYAIQQELEHSLEPTVWTQGIFQASTTSMQSLLLALDASDAALFVFTPDDVIRMRADSHPVARDNVVFELGLFVGRIGLERVFFLTPRDTQLHLPSDLLGLTPLTFDPLRSDGNWRAAVGPACSQVRQRLQAHVSLPMSSFHPADDSTLSDHDAIEILRAWLDTELLDVLARRHEPVRLDRKFGFVVGTSARLIRDAIAASSGRVKATVVAPSSLLLVERAP